MLVLVAVIGLLLGVLIGKFILKHDSVDETDKQVSRALLLNKWLENKQNNISIDLYFKRKGYKRIAIYGMGYICDRLIDDINKTDVEIDYIIDKNARALYSEYRIVRPEEKLDEVDAVIVTLSFYYDQILKTLSDNVHCDIVSLDEIVYGLLGEENEKKTVGNI